MSDNAKTRSIDYSFIVLLVCVFVYAVIMLCSLRDHYFNNDDFYMLGRAQQMLGKPFSVFMPDYVNRSHPAYISLICIEYLLFGVQPFGYYVLLIIFHCINVCLFWRLFRQLGYEKTAVFFGGLLYLVSSLHFQVVGWITATNVAVGAMFFLLAAILYVAYRQNYTQTTRIVLYSVYTLGLFCYETAVVFVGVMLAYDVLFHPLCDFKKVKVFGVYLFVIGVAVIFTLASHAGGGPRTYGLSVGIHLVQNLCAFPREIVQSLLVPRKEFIGGHNLLQLMARVAPWCVFLVFAFCVVTKNALRDFFKTQKRFLTFSILWVMITVGLFTLRPMGGVWQPRYFYLPMVGVCSLIGLIVGLLFSCVIIRKNIVLKTLFVTILCVSVFLNIRTVLLLVDLLHDGAKWKEPPGQEVMVVSVIPQLKEMYDHLPPGSIVCLENMPVHGIPLRALMNFYYQKNLIIVEDDRVEGVPVVSMPLKKPDYRFRFDNGVLINAMNATQ